MISLEDVLQSYGLEEEFPQTWTDSKDTSALAQLRDNSDNTEDSGALVDEILGTMTKNNNVSEDEYDPLGTGVTILNALKLNKKLPTQKKALLTYMPNSTAFDARKFLRDVHSSATLEDLSLGLKHLKENIAGKDQGLRSMVDTDYEKYVASKRRLDDVMTQLSQYEMDHTSSFGFKDLQMRLESIQNRFNMCERPLYGVSKEKRQLESALEGLKENKEFLELPELLENHLQNNEHEKFIREYKYKKKQLVSFSESSNPVQRQLSVFVSQRVRKIIEKYREMVTEQLMKSGPDEAYAPLLSKLIDLGAKEDIIVHWLDQLFTNFNEEIQQLFNSLNNSDYNDITGMLTTPEFGPFLSTFKPTDSLAELTDNLKLNEKIDCEPVLKQWELNLQLFEKLRSTLAKAANFCREFLSLSTDNLSSARWTLSYEQEQDMLIQCKSLVLLVAESLDTMTENWIPHNANSFSTSKYLGRILETLSSSLISAKDLVNDTQSALDGAVLRCKNKFVKLLCDSWVNDSKDIGKIQQYNSNCEISPMFSLYHRLMIEMLRFFIDINRGGPASSDLMRYSTDAFSTALKTSLRSLDSNVFIPNLNDPTALELEPSCANQDQLILSALSNVEKLWNLSLPEIFERFEVAFRQPQFCDVAKSEVNSEITKIRDQLFDVYTRKKRSIISLTVSQELERLNEVWCLEPEKKVVHISNYIYESLMILVETHALFTESCPELTKNAIAELYSNMLSSMLNFLSNIDELSLRGTLQCIADLEFVRWALYQYSQCEEKCQMIFTAIKKVCLNDDIWRDVEGPRSFVMSVLESSIKRSQFSFACLRE